MSNLLKVVTAAAEKLVLLLACVVEVFLPGSISDNLMVLLLGMAGTFTVGSVADRFSKRLNAAADPASTTTTPTPAAAPAPEESEDAEKQEIVIIERLNNLAEAVNTQTQALNFLVQYAKNSEALVNEIAKRNA